MLCFPQIQLPPTPQLQQAPGYVYSGLHLNCVEYGEERMLFTMLASQHTSGTYEKPGHSQKVVLVFHQMLVQNKKIVHEQRGHVRLPPGVSIEWVQNSGTFIALYTKQEGMCGEPHEILYVLSLHNPRQWMQYKCNKLAPIEIRDVGGVLEVTATDGKIFFSRVLGCFANLTSAIPDLECKIGKNYYSISFKNTSWILVLLRSALQSALSANATSSIPWLKTWVKPYKTKTSHECAQAFLDGLQPRMLKLHPFVDSNWLRSMTTELFYKEIEVKILTKKGGTRNVATKKKERKSPYTS